MLDEFLWTFDGLNRITSFTQGTTPQTSDYTYDATGQLIAAEHDDQTDEAYVYDLNGNRQLVDNDAAAEQHYHTGRYNRILSDGTYDYEYDAEGNRTRRTDKTSGDYTAYERDHRNRLIRVEERDDEDALLSAVDQFYDVFNRWIGSQVDEDGDSYVDTERYFIHDGNQIALEFSGYGTLAHRYLWGPAVDQLLADEHSIPNWSEPGENLWPLTDHLGTPRHHAEYDAVNDETDIVNTITYDSYGNRTDETGTTSILIGFTGRPWDEATKLQNNVNRWYEPPLGVWLSEDPIGFRALDPNLQRYVLNSPVLLVDPTGLEPPGLGLSSGSNLSLTTGNNLQIHSAGNDSLFYTPSEPIEFAPSPEEVERIRKDWNEYSKKHAAEIARRAREHEAKMEEERRRIIEQARQAESFRRGAEAIRMLCLWETDEGREILRAERHAEVEARGEHWLGDPTLLTQHRREESIRNSTNEWVIASNAILLYGAPAPYGWSPSEDIMNVYEPVAGGLFVAEAGTLGLSFTGRGRPPNIRALRNLGRGAGKMARRADDLADFADNLNDAGRVSRTHCFTAGTQVVMADQEQSAVAEDAVLDSGDWLMASLVGLAVGGSTLAKTRRKNGQSPGEEDNVRTDGSDAMREDDVSHNEVIDPDVAKEAALPHAAGDSYTDRPRSVRWRAVGAPLLSGAIALAVALLLLGRSPRHDQAATPLANARPQTKAIETIVVGDIVLAKDPQTGNVGPRTVTQVFRRQSDHLRLLDIRGSDGTEQRIETTDEHPFWVTGKGWVEAGELAVGERLEQSIGDSATVLATTRRDEPTGIPVYNIEVDGVHTYYVVAAKTDAPPVLVQNCDTQLRLFPDEPEYRQLRLFPEEPYNRQRHYGNSPKKADREALGAGADEVVDHDPPLVQRYYEGDPNRGELPGFNQTQAQREASANDRSRMSLQPSSESHSQGGTTSQYSREMRERFGLE